MAIPLAINEGFSLNLDTYLRERPPLPRPAALISTEVGNLLNRDAVDESSSRPRPVAEIPLVDLTDQDTVPYVPPIIDLTNDQDLEPLVPDLSHDEALQNLFRRLIRFAEAVYEPPEQ